MMDNIGKMIEQQTLQEQVDSGDGVAHATASGGMETQAVRMRLISRAVVERRIVKQEDNEGNLSVIVQPQEESRDSELLSPGKLSPTSVSVSGIMDSSDFRTLQPEPTYQTLTSVNGRMSPPGYSPSSSYATLTPLQPLPPISTMSDKFAYGHGNVSGSFTVMQNNGLGIGLGLGVNVNTPYAMPSMGMTPPHNYSSPGMALQQTSPISPQSAYSQNGLPSPQKSISPPSYESYPSQRELVSRTLQSPQLSPPTASLNSPDGTLVTSFSAGTINGLTLQHHTPTLVQIAPPHRDCSPSPPVLTLQQASQQSQQNQQQQNQQVQQTQTMQVTGKSGQISNNQSINVPAISADVEEINTKELAQRISAELKRYSIPQAIFAQRVLCRSQGTLSDLLRNPKPWSKLKSGRETFRRMWKWLQEPEFQRMSALRLADCQMRNVNARAVNPKRRDTTSSSCYCTDTTTRELQTERRSSEQPGTVTYPQETEIGFHRPPTTYTAGYF
ncbi:hepatocyte nuclear factor 6 isoform X2 [Coccinella septempunctata]|uniref:hepatocyte nuclear factor 6 isoform X2 n=1 Tax=Coccinella septempunctata TaxID=41139 RepID=UPI001D076BDE|nr:hepatocyte nuclear factor 6 isoform X2 [Coccinella septempunctata]XP_044765851.1 hepatocyte nuclear factor 6 isoform X2 [Coccinella septempunctata]